MLQVQAGMCLQWEGMMDDPLQLIDGEALGQFVRRGIVMVFTRLAEQLSDVQMTEEQAIGIPFTLFWGQEKLLSAWEQHCKGVGEKC